VSLRTKIVAALVVLSFVATGAIGALAYRATSRGLSSQVDQSVTASSVDLARRVADRRGPGGRGDRDQDRGGNPAPVPPIFSRPGDEQFGLLRAQFVSSRGRVVGAPDVEQLPVSAADLQMAAQEAAEITALRNITVAGDEYRMATTSVGRGRGAVQVARTLDDALRPVATLPETAPPAPPAPSAALPAASASGAALDRSSRREQPSHGRSSAPSRAPTRTRRWPSARAPACLPAPSRARPPVALGTALAPRASS
jgi:hypothetical protein